MIKQAILAGSLILIVCGMSSPGALPQNAPGDRVRWENRHLLGSPEPPSPYKIEQTFRNIDWKAPIYVAPEPGTDMLWVVLQGSEKLGPSRIVRIQDQPDSDRTENVFEVNDRLIYGLTFHPSYESNRFVFLFTNGPTSAKER